jgi:hypothetical protein
LLATGLTVLLVENSDLARWIGRHDPDRHMLRNLYWLMTGVSVLFHFITKYLPNEIVKIPGIVFAICIGLIFTVDPDNKTSTMDMVWKVFFSASAAFFISATYRLLVKKDVIKALSYPILFISIIAVGLLLKDVSTHSAGYTGYLIIAIFFVLGFIIAYHYSAKQLLDGGSLAAMTIIDVWYYVHFVIIGAFVIYLIRHLSKTWHPSYQWLFKRQIKQVEEWASNTTTSNKN